MLNKLTPEKFERLLEQLLDAVKSVEVLKGLIKLIFENAVAQVSALSPKPQALSYKPQVGGGAQGPPQAHF